MNNNTNENLNNQVPVQPVNPVEPVQPQPVPVQQPVAEPVQPMVQPAPVQQVVPQSPVVVPIEPEKKKTNGVCIAAIIFAFLMPLVGLILGIIGIGSSKKNGEKGKGLAIAAILISILLPVVLVIAFFGLIVGAVNGTSEAATAIQKGCNNLDEYGEYESRDGLVKCEDYVCEYKKNGFELSSSCNLINTDDTEESDDNYSEDVTNNITEEPEENPVEEPEEVPETNPDENTENNQQPVQPTQNSCSTKIQTPTYTENDSFMMYIDKVYTVSGRGTFISGTILRGTVELNDQVEIVGLNRETQTTVVTGLEVDGVARDSIKMGEEASILLRGLATSDIEVGQVIAKPQSVTAKSEIEVELCVLTKEDGGRHTPFFNNYLPVVQVGSNKITSTVILPAGVEMVMPGDTLTLTLKLDTPVVLETGSVITLTEGGKVIGLGKVKRLIN